MHLPIYALAAAVCALRTSAFPLPIANTPNIPSGLEEGPGPGPDWYSPRPEEPKDPLRRPDSPLSNLFPEKDGFIQTGPPVRRDEEAAIWHTEPLSSDIEDYDPLRRRDSPLHNLPNDGIVENGEHQGLASRSRKLCW